MIKPIACSLMAILLGLSLGGCSHYTAAAGLAPDKFVITKSHPLFFIGDEVFICNVIENRISNCYPADGP